MAQETLERNNIQAPEIAKAVKVLLLKGRGKHRNLMIVGPANCGKTFMLNPLCSIFNCFENPASTTFAWVGAESAEIIFLNDLRWSPQLNSWNDFLLIVKGHTVCTFACTENALCQRLSIKRRYPDFFHFKSEVDLHQTWHR